MGLGYAAIAMMGVGMYVQARGASEQARAEAKMHKRNAEVAKKDAAQVRTSSLEEQQIQREKMRRHLSAFRAQTAKGGIRMSGSPLETQLAIAEVYATDIGMMAYGSEIEAKRYESQGALSRYRASAARRAGQLAVTSALVGGGSQMMGLGVNYQMSRGEDIF